MPYAIVVQIVARCGLVYQRHFKYARAGKIHVGDILPHICFSGAACFSGILANFPENSFFPLISNFVRLTFPGNAGSDPLNKLLIGI